MKKYIIKRILLFIPTLIIISLLAFAISVNAPGDPVTRMLVASQEGGEQSSSKNLSQQKKLCREKLGLNLPLFYFELSDLASPDTLYKIIRSDQRNMVENMIADYGNAATVINYRNTILKALEVLK